MKTTCNIQAHQFSTRSAPYHLSINIYFRPERFTDHEKNTEEEMIPNDMLPPNDSDSDYDEDGGDIMTANPNRPHITFEDDDDDTCDSEEEVEPITNIVSSR